jgi:hypothetical protein
MIVLDLSTLDTAKAAEQGSTLEVKHPTTGRVLADGDGRAVTLTLAGADSQRARKAERFALNRRLRQGSRRGVGVTADELDDDALDLLSACTLAWSGFAVDGAELECNPENARRLYRQFPWLREQAQAFVDDRSNFLRASPTS